MEKQITKNVGIITYHAAYNFGSQLQAFATQEVIKRLGFNPEIINYRMKSQIDFYKRYRTKFGIKTFLYDILLLTQNEDRKTREIRFEKFIQDHLIITNEFSDPENFTQMAKKYDVLVSGSDQIWNKHSNELKTVDWKFMKPYLLYGASQRKISYASSIANSTDEEILKMLPSLKKFYAISAREKKASERLSKYLNKNIEVVLDPTLLLTRNEWIRLLNLSENRENYILYYTLNSGFHGYKRAKELKDSLISLSERLHAKIYVVSPFLNIYKNKKYFVQHNEYGPIEFMQALLNSRLVITDSFHGTALAVNLNKDIYSICYEGMAEQRKTDLLLRVGLQDRIVTKPKDIINKCSAIDYKTINKKIEVLRKNSITYLYNNLR